MAKVSGLGGYWVLDDGSLTVAHNSEYELDVESVNDDVTTSGSAGGGFVEGLPVIKKFNNATMRVPEDDDAYVEAMGLEEGTVISAWFKRGAADVYDYVDGAIVTRVRHVNNQQQARRVEITLEYGVFSRDVGAPA